MLVIFAVIIGGIATGRLLIGRRLAFVPRLITVIIWALLFLLGVEVAGDPAVVGSLATLGGAALAIFALSVAGSIFAAWLLWRRIRGRAVPADDGEAAADVPVSAWSALCGSLVIVAFFVAGCVVGLFAPFDLAGSRVSAYVLYALMFCVGITLGNDRTLADLQVAAWMLTQFATIDEVKAAVASVRIVALEKSSVVHWRIGEASGRQVVLEIVDGVPHFYENEVGVLTNAPGFEWQLTNLDNYVNLYPGDAPVRQLSGITLRPTGSNSGFLGIPGDATPPSRFVRAAFYRATAPQRATGFETVQQCFHLLNNFDIPIGIEHPEGECPDIPSATQWTSAIDLTNRRVYYKTAYNNTIRCIDLAGIDFGKTAYQSHPLDPKREQPVERIAVPE